MKTLFRPLIVLLCAAVAFSSCMKDTSAEDEAKQREAEQAFKALLSEQKTKIDAYIAANPSEAPGGWQEDEYKINLHALGETVNRGIRFEVLAVPSEEDDEAYTYEVAPGGQTVVRPEVTVNYRVFLLNGDEEAEPVQSGENQKFDFATFGPTTSSVYTPVWEYAFFPKSYPPINGNEIPYWGLTAKGLKKGSHIRVVAPSPWGYGEKAVDNIPANSPLVYEFEVLSIE